jgi:DsbC/DsbD-like thiol-disulfide interchange protein
MTRSTTNRSAVVSLAALALFTGVSRAQIGMDAPAKPKEYVVYAAEPQNIPAGRPSTVELRFHMVPGYHVNSHTPKSELLIATTLTLQPAAGVKAGSLEYPAGKPYSFSFDPSEKLDVYMGEFTVKLPVVASAGEHTLDGSLKYQACDNASCYPPRTLPVKIVFTAK